MFFVAVCNVFHKMVWRYLIVRCWASNNNKKNDYVQFYKQNRNDNAVLFYWIDWMKRKLQECTGQFAMVQLEFFLYTQLLYFCFCLNTHVKSVRRRKLKARETTKKKIFGIYLNENTARPQLREVCVLVWGIESLFEANDDDYNDDDGDDYNGINDQKELKFRLKTHTHGIRNSNNNFTGHAQIHYTRLPLPNVYMATMSVLFASLYSVEIQKCCVCFFFFFHIQFRRVCSLLYLAGIYSHSQWTVELLLVSSSTILSMVGWFLMDSFICCSLFFLIHCFMDIFFNARDCFFLIRCNFSVFIKSKLLFGETTKSRENQRLWIVFPVQTAQKISPMFQCKLVDSISMISVEMSSLFVSALCFQRSNYAHWFW